MGSTGRTLLWAALLKRRLLQLWLTPSTPAPVRSFAMISLIAPAASTVWAVKVIRAAPAPYVTVDDTGARLTTAIFIRRT